jgi:hypothetical protein
MTDYNTQLTGAAIQCEDNLTDKVTAIKNFAKSYEMRLRGGVFNTSTNSWLIKNKALVGDDFISLTTGILTSFCENSNLFTTKDKDKFLFEFADAFFKVNVMCLNDDSLKEEKYKPALKMFKDTMSNVGDIITGSKEDIKGIFDKYEEQETVSNEF